MPVDFLTDEQRQRYGRFPEELSTAQLARYFHLDDADLKLIAKRGGDHNRLGTAIQLGTVRFLGTFLTDPLDVPRSAVNHLTRQLAIADAACLERYRTGESRFDHAAEIKNQYGYIDFADQREYFRLVRWLYVRSWLSVERPSVLFDVATARLVERKALLPGVTVLERLIARVRERASVRLWRILASAPSIEQRRRLEELPVVPEGERQSPLDKLRRGPVRVSGPALVGALDRLTEIRSVGVGQIDLSGIPVNRLNVLARYAAATWAPRIARMPEDRKVATLLAFVRPSR